ncbi:MAG TPA: HD domain-containing protein, partial [Actinobacteria bacterium]|nr:HD domain-containing protein [Actinomycetota bacterium]
IGFDGEVVTHTFEDGFPIELVDANVIPEGVSINAQRLVIEGEDVTDVGCRLIERTDAEVHVGLSEGSIVAASNRLYKVIGLITLAILLMGSTATLLVSRFFTKPLETLSSKVASFGVTGGYEELLVKSGDEVGELTATFNQMVVDRKKAEKHIERLNRVLHTVGDVNRLIVKEGDPKKLLNKLCKIMVDFKGYKLAQAVLSKNDKPVFQTVALEQGQEDEEVEAMFSAEKLMPCAEKALKEEAVVIVDEGRRKWLCKNCSLSKRYIQGSSISIPLSHKGKIFGVLMVYSNLAQAFNLDEVNLLEELCGDIGFALEGAEREERRKQAEEKLEEKVIELTTLSEISKNIGSSLDLGKVLNQSLGSALMLLGAESGSIMLLDEKEEFLTVAASVGLSKKFVDFKEGLGEGIAGYVFKKRESLLLKKDLKETRFEKWKKEREIRDALSVPIKTADRIIGVFNINNKRKGTFNQSDLGLFSILAVEVGIAIDNARLYKDIRQSLLNTVKALAVAVDAKDSCTQDHSIRVAEHSLVIAKEMGLSEDEIEDIEIAARLHDVGKIGVSEKILMKKKACLTDKEWEIIKNHPKTSAKILEPVNFPPNVISCVLYHHERLDGKGYPSGISKKEIPLGASIIKVADAFDAMTSDRPYRKALSYEKAVNELNKYKGTQFHPEVVEAFLRIYEKETKKKRSEEGP